MGRRKKSASLGLWMNGDYVGRWEVSSSGAHALHYEEAWIDSERGRPISLSMPFRPVSEPYKGELVRSYFENLLPDNENIRNRIARRFNTTTDAFDLLAQVGRDCVGAIQLLPDGEIPRGLLRIDAVQVSDDQIEAHLSRLRNASVALPGIGMEEDDDFRISIAGNQEKTAFLFNDGKWCIPHGSTPTSHIFKLPLGMTERGLDLSTSVENEWLCLHILAGFGLPTAKAEMLSFGEKKILSVERFDRQRSGKTLIRLPQEDFAQVCGIPQQMKYEEKGGPGIKRIMEILKGASNKFDGAEFFKTQVLFWMLAAIDGHAKNFSVFIARGGTYALTPRYDVLSAYPVMGHGAKKVSPEKAKMAMAVWGKNRHYRWSEILRRHFEQTGASCGISNAGETIDEIVRMTSEVVSEVRRYLPKDFPANIADSILSGFSGAAKKLDLLKR